jgi:transketolase
MKQIDPNKLRKIVLDLVYTKKSGHIGGCFSIADIVAYLYSNYNFINENKFILSKGHSVPIVYAALSELELISEKELFEKFREIDSPYQGHPHIRSCEYIHATTGSLGQGLSIAIGHALAMKINKQKGKVFCIIGDGELEEGQVWEAIRLAPRLKLDNLICILDNNGFSNDNRTRWENVSLSRIIDNFGWDFIGYIKETRDIPLIFNKRIMPITGLPGFIVSSIDKGHGTTLSSIGNYHSTIPDKIEYEQMSKELGYE